MLRQDFFIEMYASRDQKIIKKTSKIVYNIK